MGRELIGHNRTFREAIEECDAHFRPMAGWSLMNELLKDENTDRMNRTAVAQPTNFALQVGLTRVWHDCGVAPEAIIGHSAGEIAAAWASEALTLSDATLVIFHRSRLQDTLRGTGRLAATGLSEAEALQLPG